MIIRHCRTILLSCGASVYISNAISRQSKSQELSSAQIVYRDEEDFRRKRSNMVGPDGLKIVSDFDFTMTKFWLKGVRGASCHKVLEDSSMVPKEYRDKAQELQRIYYPLEVSIFRTCFVFFAYRKFYLNRSVKD